MCRTLLDGSDFTGASFVRTNLRFCFMAKGRGLVAAQLRVAYSLFKAEVPPDLASGLLDHTKVDPEF